jgi:WD40 repeat protein
MRLFDTETGQQVAVLGRDDEPHIKSEGMGFSLEMDAEGKEITRVNGKEVRVDPTADQGECAAFSPDDTRVAVACWQGTVKFWDAQTGQFLTSWKGKQANPQSIAYSPDGQRLLLVYGNETDKDGTVSVRATGDGKELVQWPFDRPGSRSALFSPDGRQVLIFPNRLYRKYQKYDFHGADGEFVLAAPQERIAVLADAESGKELAFLRGHEADITSACFSAASGQVLTASLDGTARLWDAGPAPEYALVLRGHSSPVGVARFSRDGQRLFTAFGPRGYVGGAKGGDRAVRMWDVASGKSVAVLRGLESLADSKARDQLLGQVDTLDVSSDGERLATVSRDWRDAKEAGGEPEVAFTPVRVWDARTGKLLFGLPGFLCGARSATFSPDGTRLLVVSDNEERIRHSNGNGEYHQLRTGPGVGKDAHLGIWDAHNGKLVRSLLGENEYCYFAAWSPDGSRILTVSPGRMWDAATGKELFRLEPEKGAVEAAVFSPDGRSVVGVRSSSDPLAAVVPLWDARTGKLRVLLAGHADAVTAAVFSPDGAWLATTSRDGSVRLWDPATGKERFVLHGHERAGNGAAFSPDGKRLATVSEDILVRLWDVESGLPWMTLTGHAGPVYSAVFSPDGERLATTSGDGTVRLWPVDPLPLARSRRPRTPTAAERLRFGLEAVPEQVPAK